MGLPCKRNLAKLCTGCGACEPPEEYELRCDVCKREIENLEVCLMLGDNAYCQECADKGWTQWHKTGECAGFRLHRVRKMKKIHGDALSSHLGVTRNMLSRWESGNQPISEKHFEKIREIVGDDF
ncbi:MAG: helix-turn-helix transcriptional regulator [Bacteroidaceae bacterium]|nr:helix-turn-helix transcriptional regulator [Bacteroidaceae bacterium]